jgi:hypothetical protein
VIQTASFVFEDKVLIRAMSLDEYIATKLTQSGITMKGLISTPWELVPYSFVVDWFVNVGDYINALIPSPLYNQLVSGLTTVRTSTVKASAVSTLPASSSLTIVRPVSGSLIATQEQHVRSQGLMAPSLVVKSDFRFSNITRASDACALLVQRLKGA